MVIILFRMLWMCVGIHSLSIEKAERLILNFPETLSEITTPISTTSSRSSLACFVECLQADCDSVIYCKALSTCSLYLTNERVLNVYDAEGNPDQCTYLRRKNFVTGNGENGNEICNNGTINDGINQTLVSGKYQPFSTGQHLFTKVAIAIADKLHSVVHDSYTLIYETGNCNINGALLHRNLVMGFRLGLSIRINENGILDDGTNFTRVLRPSVVGFGSDYIQGQIMNLMSLSGRSADSDIITTYEILTSNGKKISLNSSSAIPETTKTSLQWYMKQYNGTRECYSIHSNGSVTGDIEDCVAAIQSGSGLYIVTGSFAGPVLVEIRNSSFLEYAFPINLDFNQVNGEDFKPYNDFVGLRAVAGRSNEARFITTTVRLENSNQFIARFTSDEFRYFIDTDWQEAYAADEKGLVLRGTTQYLLDAIISGRRVRVMIHSTYSARILTVNSVLVHVPDKWVQGIASGYPHTYDVLSALKPALRFSSMNPNGYLKVCVIEVGNPSVLSDVNFVRRKMEWYVESKEWKQVMKTDEHQSIINGSIEDLTRAVLDQNDIRLIIKTSNQYRLVVDVTEAKFYGDDTFTFQFGPVTMEFSKCLQWSGFINESLTVQIVETVPYHAAGNGTITYIKDAIEWFTL